MTEESEPAYSAYGNAAISTIVNADSQEEAKQAFCSPGDTYTILLESGIKAQVEIDKGIDIGEAEPTSSTTNQPIPADTDDSDEDRIDPHSTDPDIAAVKELVSSKLSEDEFSISKVNDIVSLQLHTDRKTGEIATALTQSDYSFRVSQTFECPPKFRIQKQITPPKNNQP